MDERHAIDVRPAAAGDLDAIARVWRESALAMDGGPDVPSLEALRLRIDTELRNGWSLHVATHDEHVVGLLALKPDDSILDQIFVSPDEQGSGVGKTLLDHAKVALPGGFTLRMAEANRKARRFYEKHGMEILGEGVHPHTGVPVLFYGWNKGR